MKLLILALIGLFSSLSHADGFFPTYNPNGGLAPQQQVVDPSQQSYQQYMQQIQQQQNRQVRCTYQPNGFGGVTQVCN